MQPAIPIDLYYTFLALTVTMVAVVGTKMRQYFPEPSWVLWIFTLWFAAQYLMGKLGWFADGLGEFPPRIMVFVLPNMIFLSVVAFSTLGERIAAPFSITFLTGIQVFRVGVEVVLWLLAERSLLPKEMSIEGRNVDLLVGITAPVMMWLYTSGKVSVKGLIVWNIAGLIIVTNVVVHGILTVPGIGVIASNVPNYIVSYAPFNLLPGVLVPFAYLFHILSIRKLHQLKQ